MFKQVLLAMLVIAPFVFTSCNDDDNIMPKKEVTILKGAFVCNEGDFSKNTGAISWFNFEHTVSDPDIFLTKNGAELGDVVQSFSIVDTLGIIVVNNSQKVEIVHMKDFSSLATITGLSYPRFVMPAADGKIYISNGNGFGDDKLIVYDYEQMAVAGEITVGKGPERMAKIGSRVYVANSGAFVNDSTVSVVDVTTDGVVETIEVGKRPVDIDVDADNNIWVICQGETDWNTFEVVENAKIYKINSTTNQVVKTYDFGGSLATFGSNLIAMSSDKTEIVFLNDALYKMGINAEELPTEKWVEGSFYGISVDPETGDVYACDATNKKVIAYDYVSGTVLKELVTNISYPNDVVFNRIDFTEE